MGLRGPNPKSAELRILEGQRAHRPLPEPKSKYAAGVPDRPKGMTAAARRIWDGYVDQLAGSLRLVDGFALRRLCEDVALLEELQAGMRRMAGVMKRAERDRLKSVEEQLVAVRASSDEAAAAALESERIAILIELSSGAMAALAKTHDGRRLTATINALAGRIGRDQLQFGLTPVSAGRVEGGMGMPMASVEAPGIEEALCG